MQIKKLEIENEDLVLVHLREGEVRVCLSKEDIDQLIGDTCVHTCPRQPKQPVLRIGSVETFEKQLEEAQKLLGIEPYDFIPVTYTTNWRYLSLKTIMSL